MKPYYQDDSVTIYHGRWQDLCVAGRITGYDLIVTDPPYGTGGWRRGESGAGSNPAASLVREEWDDGATRWLTLSDGQPVLSFWPAAHTRELLIEAQLVGLTKHRALYLQKPDPRPQVAGRTAWSIEPVWALSREGFVLLGGTDLFTASTPRKGRDTDATGHPYEKPLAFMRWLIGKTQAECILDPFMGSGTTLRAARDLGRRAIGIEQDERWCEIAARRCSQEVLGLSA
jgi:site-specific DNA-methyltransferase (adenine-specific)